MQSSARPQSVPLECGGLVSFRTTVVRWLGAQQLGKKDESHGSRIVAIPSLAWQHACHTRRASFSRTRSTVIGRYCFAGNAPATFVTRVTSACVHDGGIGRFPCSVAVRCTRSSPSCSADIARRISPSTPSDAPALPFSARESMPKKSMWLIKTSPSSKSVGCIRERPAAVKLPIGRRRSVSWRGVAVTPVRNNAQKERNSSRRSADVL